MTYRYRGPGNAREAGQALAGSWSQLSLAQLMLSYRRPVRLRPGCNITWVTPCQESIQA